MRAYLFILISLLTYIHSTAQNKEFSKLRSFQIGIGASKHGTGDMNGFLLNTEYRTFFRKKLFHSHGISATIHDGSLPIFYTNANGSLVDGSYRYTTAGIQLTSKLGIAFYRYNRNEFGGQAGVLLRYQTSSYFDEINILYPAATGLPTPVVTIANKSKQRTVAVGGIGQIFYHYSFTKKIFAGIVAGLQTDTNGDTLTQLAISCGFQF
ncbi:MAG: hypothetical protein ACTHMM_20315 [Agriterribacter sp.]